MFRNVCRNSTLPFLTQSNNYESRKVMLVDVDFFFFILMIETFSKKEKCKELLVEFLCGV